MRATVNVIIMQHLCGHMGRCLLKSVQRHLRLINNNGDVCQTARSDQILMLLVDFKECMHPCQRNRVWHVVPMPNSPEWLFYFGPYTLCLHDFQTETKLTVHISCATPVSNALKRPSRSELSKKIPSPLITSLVLKITEHAHTHWPLRRESNRRGEKEVSAHMAALYTRARSKKV